MVEQNKYMVAINTSKSHRVFYKETRYFNGDTPCGLDNFVWNSKTKEWKHSTCAIDAFMGFDIYADPIEESEVLDYIEQFT